MTPRELRSLVRKGENDRLEFKKKVDYPEKVIKEITAFANTYGGKLLIGVDDNGFISGLKYPDEDQFVLEKTLETNCLPTIPFSVEQIMVAPDLFVLKYTIERSDLRPHAIRNGNGKSEFYVRLGDRSIKASREVVEIMKRQRKGKDTRFTFGDSEKLLIDYLENNSSITIEEYALMAGLTPYQATRKLILLVLANVLLVVPGEKQDLFELKRLQHNNKSATG